MAENTATHTKKKMEIVTIFAILVLVCDQLDFKNFNQNRILSMIEM